MLRSRHLQTVIHLVDIERIESKFVVNLSF